MRLPLTCRWIRTSAENPPEFGTEGTWIMIYSGSVESRIVPYAIARGLTLPVSLGAGKDGTVYFASGPAKMTRAVKVFQRSDLYHQELRVYRRLAHHAIESIAGHAVPVLVHHDNELGVLEMSVVTPPYILDFASAALDAPPDFPPHALRERERHWLSVFGTERWARVQVILAALRRLGIHYLDPNRRNITFRPDQEAAWDAALAAQTDQADSSSPDPDAKWK